MRKTVGEIGHQSVGIISAGSKTVEDLAEEQVAYSQASYANFRICFKLWLKKKLLLIVHKHLRLLKKHYSAVLRSKRSLWFAILYFCSSVDWFWFWFWVFWNFCCLCSPCSYNCIGRTDHKNASNRIKPQLWGSDFKFMWPTRFAVLGKCVFVMRFCGFAVLIFQKLHKTTVQFYTVYEVYAVF